MSLATQLIEANLKRVPSDSKSEVNPHRVTMGRVFMQPTGGKKGKPFNFSYCYFGAYGEDGKYIGGFSMSNLAMLQMVEAKLLGEDMAQLFQQYAAAHPTETLIKGQ